MKQHVWDPERKCYYSRGIGFYANFIILAAMGIASVVFIVFLVRSFGLGVLVMLIPGLVLWIPLYSWLWDLFSADWMWPRESLESIRWRECQAWERYCQELAENESIRDLIECKSEKERRRIVNGYFK